MEEIVGFGVIGCSKMYGVGVGSGDLMSDNKIKVKFFLTSLYFISLIHDHNQA